MQKFKDDADAWQRFLDLLDKNKPGKPTDHVLENEAIAAAFPADHAYRLLERFEYLKTPVLKRHGKKLLGMLAVPAVTTAVKSVIDHWDKVSEVIGGLFSFMAVAVIVTYWLRLRKQ